MPTTLKPRRSSRARKQRRILELFGKLEWDPRFDYKKERGRR